VSGAIAGQPWILTLDFYSETSGALADPSSVQLDLTYGQQVGLAPDVAGPYTYQGASIPTAGQVWRTGVGQYSFIWQVPATASQGVYVANWTCGYGAATYLGVENFTVSGSMPLAVPSGDVGYWTGGLIYGSQDIEFGKVDGNGITWLWRKLEGWDGPDVQGGGVIARAGDHGAWASPQFYAARTMTLTVTASAPTQALRDVARATLQQALPVSDLAMLRYDEPISKYAWVRRSGKATETYPTLTDVTWTIGLVAPDPRKYATVQRSLPLTLLPSGGGGGMVTPFTVPFTLHSSPPPGGGYAFNGGSFLSPPVVVLTGPASGPTITNASTGQTVSWSSLTLNTGDVFAIDFLNRQGYINPTTVSTSPGFPSVGGTYWPSDLTSSWWQLAPGSNTLQYGGSIGSGSTATAYWHDSYI
jgi:hypothetical protein